MTQELTCDICGITDQFVEEFDPGSLCHREWEDCVAALKREIERLKADLDACLAFISKEMQWCGFRADFGDTESEQNAKKLAKFLARFQETGKGDDK